MATYRSLADLADLTQDELLTGLINELKAYDQLTAALIANAQVTDRPTIKGNRLASVGTPVYADCSTSLTSEAISSDPFTYDLMTLVKSFDVCTTAQNLYSTFDDVLQSELRGAIQAMSLKIAEDAITGNGTTEISGLETQITNTFNRAGASLDMGDIDRLMDEVSAHASPNVVLVGAPATVRAVLAELRAESGGMTYDVLAGTEMKVPSYLGTKILRSEYVTANYLHAVDLNSFQLFIGQAEDMNVGGIFALQDVGALESSLAKRWRIYCHLAAVLKNRKAVATLINA